MVEPDDRRAVAAADLVHQADAKPHGSDGWTDPRVIQNRDQGVDDHHTNGIVGLAVFPEGFDQPLDVVDTETPTQLLLLPISGINQPVLSTACLVTSMPTFTQYDSRIVLASSSPSVSI